MAGSAAQLRASVQSKQLTCFHRDSLLAGVCRDRREYYLNEARKYMRDGDTKNALACVNEGLRSTSGPVYLAVRDELEQLHIDLNPLVPVYTRPVRIHPSLLLNAHSAL
jgi:hypothetical protein